MYFSNLQKFADFLKLNKTLQCINLPQQSYEIIDTFREFCIHSQQIPWLYRDLPGRVIFQTWQMPLLSSRTFKDFPA